MNTSYVILLQQHCCKNINLIICILHNVCKLILNLMKMSNLKLFSITCLGMLSFLGCGGGNTSRGTGWDINSKKGGFQYNIEFNDQETGPGLVFIEGGTFTKGQVQDDVPREE